MIRLVAFLLRKRCVVLTDFEGRQNLTWRNKNFNGKGYHAYIHPLVNVGWVRLNEDGSTTGVSYIETWELLNGY